MRVKIIETKATLYTNYSTYPNSTALYKLIAGNVYEVLETFESRYWSIYLIDIGYNGISKGNQIWWPSSLCEIVDEKTIKETILSKRIRDW